MGELKPCPFCGGSALLRGFAVDEAMHWWVACENCGATSGELLAESTPDRDFAVESWNHRTHPQPVTPAGGEVVGWQERYLQGVPGEEWSFCKNETAEYRERLKNAFEFRPVFLHPPVADAALDALRQISAMCPETCEMTNEHAMAQIATDAIAALNQRGGGE